MGCGGPSAGYVATRGVFKRNMPGRIIGVSVDRLGNRALRMALQMREQHIKRERATSNICTASALMASMAGFYCVYNGPEGLRRAAMTAHTSAAAAADALEAMGYKLASRNIFDTREVEAEAAVIQDIALARGINFFYPSEGKVRLSFDEVTTPEEVAEVVGIGFVDIHPVNLRAVVAPSHGREVIRSTHSFIHRFLGGCRLWSGRGLLCGFRLRWRPGGRLRVFCFHFCLW